MRLLFLGDVVGRTGRLAVIDQLPGLRERYDLDFAVVNGENAAGGFGINEKITEDLLEAGAVDLYLETGDPRQTRCGWGNSTVRRLCSCRLQMISK